MSFLTISIAKDITIPQYQRDTQHDEKLKANSTVLSLAFNNDDSFIVRGSMNKTVIFRTENGNVFSVYCDERWYNL